jgi:hypothetical protein
MPKKRVDQLTWTERMKRDKRVAKAVREIQRFQLWVDCSHCGSMLGIDLKTGKVSTSFGPVTLEDNPSVTEYRFVKVDGKPVKHKPKPPKRKKPNA